MKKIFESFKDTVILEYNITDYIDVDNHEHYRIFVDYIKHHKYDGIHYITMTKDLKQEHDIIGRDLKKGEKYVLVVATGTHHILYDLEQYHKKLISKDIIDNEWDIDGKYTVSSKNGELSCECKGFTFRGKCKHVEDVKNRLSSRISKDEIIKHQDKWKKNFDRWSYYLFTIDSFEEFMKKRRDGILEIIVFGDGRFEQIENSFKVDKTIYNDEIHADAYYEANKRFYIRTR